MQGKGVIRFFLIALAVVSLIQFLFMLPTRGVEKRADEHAKRISANTSADKQAAAYKAARSGFLDSMSSETVLKLPLIPGFTYQDLKSKQIALGLDLKGGMSVVLQVDLRDLIRSLSNNAEDPTLQQALEKASNALASTQLDYITLFGRSWREIANGKKLSDVFATSLDDVTYQTSDGEIERILRSKANQTVSLTFGLLKERIDKLGVIQPNISLDAARDLITVELPGIDNPQRARNFLQAAAALEFWDTYRLNDAGLDQGLLAADQRLKTLLRDTNTVSTIARIDTTFVTDSLGNFSTEIAKIDTTYQEDALGGPLLSILTPSGGGAVIGVVERNKRDLVIEYLSRDDIRSLFPRDVKFVWSKDQIVDQTTNEETTLHELYAVKIPNDKKAPLEGDVVTNAEASPDPTTGEMQVSLTMNQEGAKTWANMTTRAAQNGNREIAIILDNEVVSAPRVNGPITGGRSSISGSFTTQEAQDLANILEVGKLPARTQIIQESLVGPTLGQKNINSSLTAMAIGFLLVIVYMLFYYGGAGLVSIIALLLNLFFILAALASFGTVLTVPGIAGIVLTIGMAVDANVIIYERIREELREGKTLLASVQEGFRQSYSSIIDANVTTFITGAILAWYGLGPIKGFAVVLMIGLVTTVFTAVLVSGIIIESWVSKGRTLSFWTAPTKNTFTNINVDWMSMRRWAYFISGGIILLGFVSMFLRGFELGVDFKGGYSFNIEVEKSKSVDVEAMRQSLSKTLDGSSLIVKAVDSENTFNVVTDYLITSNDTTATEQVITKVHEGVNQLLGGTVALADFKNQDATGTHITSSSKVGATISDDIKKSALWAGIFSVLGIFLYILIRFGKGLDRQYLGYPLGAIIATLHDALMVLAVFSIFHGLLPFSLEVDQTFVGAILTVIGYSINDTVVVFDRIREYFNQYTNRKKEEVVNMAINTTLTRTLNTALTTLFTIVALFLLGGASIKGFAFAMFIGVFVGTYSSIFIAAPIMSDIMGDLKPKAVEKTAPKAAFSKTARKAKTSTDI